MNVTVTVDIREVLKDSVVVLRPSRNLTSEERRLVASGLHRSKAEGKFPDVPVLVLPHGWSLDAIPESEMNRLGWFRKE